MRTSRRSTIAGERPLNPAERTALVVAAATTTLLFYVVTTIISAALFAISTVLLVVTIGAARVGLSGTVGAILQREWLLLKIVLRSL